jgi:glycerol-3-phosphate dehydrogenase (NAD(P)+)
MWARRPELVESINAGRNSDYLPDLELPPTVRATADPEEALAGADMVVLVVPSQTLRDNLGAWGAAIPAGVPVVSLMKGVELGTTMRMSEVITEAGHVDPDRVVVLSGPNLAAEIALQQPAAGVVACRDMSTAERVATTCATTYYRPYTDTDVVGAEVCGATKNVVALASGMAEGLGFGDNTKATIITRGLAEITRLGLVLGAHPQTFMGLAGVGDLIATCMSPLSRNHSFGVLLGRGRSVDEATAELSTTTEGVKSSQSILTLAREHGVDLPICEQVVAVIRDGLPAKEVGARLMSRDLKAEKH